MTPEAVVVVVGTIATVISVAVLVGLLPARGQPPPPPPSAARSAPNQLRRIERIVERAGESGLAAHTQLRPLLIEIAEARLGRRGLRLGDDRARALLGRDAWELVRPDRPEPADDRAARVAAGELERVLDRLEAL